VEKEYSVTVTELKADSVCLS